MAPLLLRPAPLFGSPLCAGFSDLIAGERAAFPFADLRLTPHYPAPSPLQDVLRLVPPGSDEYQTERYAFEIASLLQGWSEALRTGAHDHAALAKLLDPAFAGCSLVPASERVLRSDGAIQVTKRQFSSTLVPGSEAFLKALEAQFEHIAQVKTAEFQVTSVEEIGESPLAVRTEIRYDIVADRKDGAREGRIGTWRTEWLRDGAGNWKARRWEVLEETVSVARGPMFIDVTAQALGGTASYASQMLHGSDYWRTVLDGACGIDVYGNNGLAAGDFDNDGFDDLYVCQPAGLPNRLYRNRGDGTFEDVTDEAGVGVLDNTACALFADFQNRGLQDLLVVCGSGPLLFNNQGNGTFALKRDAFRFARPPQGSFTHAAIADYDRDGRLDIYFCLYSYYLGLDQYHYPVPYFDARNGPANCLMHNQGDGTFVDRTEAAGLNAANDRYSFACAWGESGTGGAPDLYVANDFGRSSLYRNNGDGTFTPAGTKSHVEDPGAGMSASWADVDNDGRQDIYVANMWSAAGQRVSAQKRFHQQSPEDIRALYRRHARGNSLYRNQGDGQFENVSQKAGVEMGRWAWGSDFWDFDHDGYADLYVANGYISGLDRDDLGSFFWRQVVAKSPDDNTPTGSYERGWQALNELIRSDRSWSGYERNVMFANNRDGSFSEISGVVGLDFPEDSRSFALADIDHDGRLEVILKNRSAPQVRIVRNDMEHIGDAIAFRLRGRKSNRDGIGAAITVQVGTLRQTKYLQAGSGFLAQHSKEVFFGLGKAAGGINAKVRWPSGTVQEFANLPANQRIEIEEGSDAFAAHPFAAASAAFAKPASPAQPESLPAQVETWLIEPLRAPDFALPDLAGNTRGLRGMRGGLVLLQFWTTNSPLCREQLRLLHRRRSAFAAAKLSVLAVNVDDAAASAQVRSLAAEESLSFPVVIATAEVAGLYNIIYRYLFDRRRDLALPSSLLLDADGMIVKVYQGPLDPDDLLQDVAAIPTTPAQRAHKALPFAGVLYQGSFARNDFTYGVAMFQHGYLDQAAQSFAEVIAAKPDDAEAYYNLGTLHLRRNDLPEARRYLEQTVKLRPDYPEAWNNLGMIAAQSGQPDEAINAFRQSLTLRPGYATALLNLGNVYRRQGALDKAEECLQKALELQPDDPEANYSVGMLYAQHNQMQRASDYLQKAIALRPDYPEALNNLGVLFVREQDYAKAETQFETCIRLSPGFDQSYINLARLYALRNDKQRAREILQSLLSTQPENAHAKQALDLLESSP